MANADATLAGRIGILTIAGWEWVEVQAAHVVSTDPTERRGSFQPSWGKNSGFSHGLSVTTLVGAWRASFTWQGRDPQVSPAGFAAMGWGGATVVFCEVCWNRAIVV